MNKTFLSHDNVHDLANYQYHINIVSSVSTHDNPLIGKKVIYTDTTII